MWRAGARVADDLLDALAAGPPPTRKETLGRIAALLERNGAKETDTMTPQEIEDNSRSYQTSFPDKAQQYESFNASRTAKALSQ